MNNHTFVIPVYQESPYLEECIHSLLEQTADSEVIITTSTPTPFTQKLAKQYGIAYHINPKATNGIAADWNFALSTAGTPLVTITHQDDIYEPEFAQRVTEKFDRHPKTLISFTNYSNIINDDVKTGGINALVKRTLLWPFTFCKRIGCRFLKQHILSFGDPICCPSVTFNKAELGDFTFNDQYKVALDWYAWYQLAKRKGAFIYINKKLMQHRIHTQSETARQINSGLRRQEEHRIFELMWGKVFAKGLSAIYAIGHKENVKA